MCLSNRLNRPAALPKSVFSTRLLGKQVYHFEQLASTNTTALELAEQGTAEGALVLADSQSAGRGQGDHQWYSPPGLGLYFSLILRPALSQALITPITLCAGIALARALTRICGIRTQIKWPNDLILRDKKVGGILVEGAGQQERLKYLVMGIGINLNHTRPQFPPELRNSATSLQAETGRIFDRSDLLPQLLTELEQSYMLFLKEGFSPFIPAFKKLDYLAGKQVVANTPQAQWRGQTAGIDQTGALLLRLPGTNKLKKIVSGSVQTQIAHTKEEGTCC